MLATKILNFFFFNVTFREIGFGTISNSKSLHLEPFPNTSHQEDITCLRRRSYNVHGVKEKEIIRFGEFKFYS